MSTRWLDSTACILADQESKPVSRPCGFPSTLHPYLSFGSHTEITLQDVPNREYTLRLFVENVEREVQRTDNNVWTPAQRQYVPHFSQYVHSLADMHIYSGVSLTSQIRAEVRMKSGRWFWAKYREAGEVIDLQELFREYWSSNKQVFIVLGQSLSPTGPRRSD